MTDLAERIRELTERNEQYRIHRGAPCYRAELQADLAELLCANAPTILAGLAALEERDKLRAAMTRVKFDVQWLHDFVSCPVSRDHLSGVLVAIDEALFQPTPTEETK